MNQRERLARCRALGIGCRASETGATSEEAQFDRELQATAKGGDAAAKQQTVIFLAIAAVALVGLAGKL